MKNWYLTVINQNGTHHFGPYIGVNAIKQNKKQWGPKTTAPGGAVWVSWTADDCKIRKCEGPHASSPQWCDAAVAAAAEKCKQVSGSASQSVSMPSGGGGVGSQAIMLVLAGVVVAYALLRK